MTVIVGIEQEGSVWIGGDSAGIAGGVVTQRPGQKVFHVGEFLYGISGSFRGGSVLRYAFAPPQRYEKEDPLAYLNTRFMDRLRSSLSDAGIRRSDSGIEATDNLCFLLGYRGRLYQVWGDFQVGHDEGGYAAMGSGQEIALGALHATAGLDPEARVRAALEAAEVHNIGVRGPFTIARLAPEP